MISFADAASQHAAARQARYQATTVELEAEDAMIAAAWQASNGGHLDVHKLIELYDYVRNSEITGWAARWARHIPYDVLTLRRMAINTPDGDDQTWKGDTGFTGIDLMTLPGKGATVAYILFGNGACPVHIGYSSNFRNAWRKLHRDGYVWASWQAWLCKDDTEAFAKRAQLIKEHGRPNIAVRAVADQPHQFAAQVR
jgi:hypothetical protein